MSESALLLEACDGAKGFDSVVALKAASLTVRPGEVHGLMGANGAGKSALVKVITGVFPAGSGLTAVKGMARSFRSPAEAHRAGIVSVDQDPVLVPDLTIAQTMRLASAPLDAVRKWLAKALVEEAAATDKVRSVNQNMRFDQSMRVLKQLLERNELGMPVPGTIEMRAKLQRQSFRASYRRLTLPSFRFLWS